MKIIIPNSTNEKTMEKKHPHEMLNNFFEWYSFEDAKKELWEWVLDVMCSSDINAYNEPAKRSELFFFYEKLKGLIEAAHIIHKDNSYPGWGYA
jgi:hypothetical protein